MQLFFFFQGIHPQEFLLANGNRLTLYFTVSFFFTNFDDPPLILLVFCCYKALYYIRNDEGRENRAFMQVTLE